MSREAWLNAAAAMVGLALCVLFGICLGYGWLS